MGCVKIDTRGAALVHGLQETTRAKAPVVARLQPDKAEFGARGGQVIADIFRPGQEFRRHDGTDRMAALILGTGVAMTVAKETGQRIKRAGGQRLSEDIEGGVFVQTMRTSSLVVYTLPT